MNIQNMLQFTNEVESSLHNGSWFVDYIVPVLSIVGVAFATMFGSLWAKMRELRALSSIEIKDTVLIPLACEVNLLFTYLESDNLRELTMKNEIAGVFSLDKIEYFIKIPQKYKTPEKFLGLIQNALDESGRYISNFNECVEQSWKIARTGYNDAISRASRLIYQQDDFIRNSERYTKSLYLFGYLGQTTQVGELITKLKIRGTEHDLNSYGIDFGNIDGYITRKELQMQREGYNNTQIRENLDYAYTVKEIILEEKIIAERIRELVTNQNLYKLYDDLKILYSNLENEIDKSIRKIKKVNEN